MDETQSNDEHQSIDERNGSIATALAGEYSLTLSDVLNEAWNAIDGYKFTLLMSVSLLFAIFVGLGIVQYIFVGPDDSATSFSLIGLVITLVSYGFVGVYSAGIMVMSARISMGNQVSATDAFVYMPLFLKALVTYVLMTLMISLGFLLLIVPGIYLSVAYFYALPLALHKGLSPWEALETSRKAVTHRWFTLLGLHIIVGALNILGFITLGIAMIWLLPLSIVAYGIAYRNMFGIDVSRRQF